ncbi:MAG: S-methyl-5-thioribose-1-phosphate isomerase [Chloroflexi bacterium]|nr:S-methyl-5-thioribose-1-phosphate isomerase [Chloroflexota bacterium]
MADEKQGYPQYPIEETLTVFWEDGKVAMIDQRILPETFQINYYETYEAVADAIKAMVVRGAPAIGASAGFGMAIAAQQSTATTVDDLRTDLKRAGDVLAKSRPTAVNLFWGIERMLKTADDPGLTTVEQAKARLLDEAQQIAEEDIATNQRMGAFGAELVPENATIIHHCNTGSLAAVAWGTALGVVRSAFFAGKNVRVLVDETRPRLQGARLTSWELKNLGIDHAIIVDGASGHYLRRGEADLCLVGADRIAANGDTANKIGTYNLAVVAHENNVPFYVVAPFSTIDFRTPTGDDIEIEERSQEEVTRVAGHQIAPEGVSAGNPAFDVTPHRYITAIVTERGVVRPPFDVNLRALAAAPVSEA